MLFHSDPLWGYISIKEPVIQALVSSSAMQRLRGIAQAGASAYLFPEKAAITRFDHSLGVMHVLFCLGAALEEQIAGLLHDIPHTAFSHTIDTAFPSAAYNYHEQFHRDIVMRSEIPAILAKHNIRLEAALEPERFPLVEQPLPALCADRLDYTLRDRHAAGHTTSSEANEYLTQLIPGPYGIAHADVDSALWLALHFAEANRTYWTSPDEAGSYWTLGNAIRRAVELGSLSERELFATDAEVMARLVEIADPEIAAYLSLLKPDTRFFTVTEGSPYFETQMKQRIIDPLVHQSGTPEPELLSRLSPLYAQMLADIPPAGTLTYRLWSDKMPLLLKEVCGDMSLLGQTA